MATHFVDITDHPADWLNHVLDVAHHLFEEHTREGRNQPILDDKTLAMLFEKPSLRTRVSFEQAMYDLGGHAVVLSANEVGIGKRESAADIARVLEGMVDGIMARVFEHAKLTEMASASTVPIINALSDDSHPCQALADVMTMQQAFGRDLSNRTIAFVGDGNNVARSLARLCNRLGIRFVLSAPEGYRFSDGDLGELAPHADQLIEDPFAAVAEADAIYTDTFVSMGQEDEKQKRLDDFAGFQVNEALLAKAPDHAIVLHCLPAYRGVEISAGVMDGPQSRVFPQAHNRLHAQKGLLAVLLGDA